MSDLKPALDHPRVAKGTVRDEILATSQFLDQDKAFRAISGNQSERLVIAHGGQDGGPALCARRLQDRQKRPLAVETSLGQRALDAKALGELRITAHQTEKSVIDEDGVVLGRMVDQDFLDRDVVVRAHQTGEHSRRGRNRSSLAARGEGLPNPRLVHPSIDRLGQSMAFAR